MLRRPTPWKSTTVLLTDITRKDIFCLAFYFKWKYFVLNDHILSETICLLCFCVLFSNMYPKIKFMAKHWSDLCNFYSKVIFWCAEFELLMFHNNIVKLSEKLNKRNLLKICLQVTYPTDFCMIWLHFYYGKKWKYLIFWKLMTRMKLFVHKKLRQMVLH